MTRRRRLPDAYCQHIAHCGPSQPSRPARRVVAMAGVGQLEDRGFSGERKNSRNEMTKKMNGRPTNR